MKSNIRIKINAEYDTAELHLDGNVLSFKYREMYFEKFEYRPFLALKQLRKNLEEYNIFLLINGSRKDVYAFGTSMSTLGAYVLRLGEQANSKNLVGTFEDTDREDLISTVQEQEEYYKRWIASF